MAGFFIPVLPANDGRLYYEHADDTNRWLGEIQKQYPDKFYAFADVLKEGAYFYADRLELVPVFRKAAELKVPVAIYSNPCRVGFHGNSAPDKINKMIQIFPDINFITAHMGGMKWQDAITGCSYVHISAVLSEFVNLYGMEQTNRILRRFGVNRLIFATNYPDVWFTKPEEIYETYCNILNRMDFTEAEAEEIAYKNILGILKKA